MIIERIATQDLPAVGELQPQGWSDIVKSFRYYIEKPFCRPIKLTIDGTIAGVGAAISFGRTAWLAHIIVRPEYRKQGIGTGIVRHVCRSLQDGGTRTILLIATDLGFPVYKKVGFREQTEYVVFERETPLQSHGSSNVVPLSDRDMDTVVALDKKVSGEERARLLTVYLSSAWVYKQSTQIGGAFFPQLDEGLIIADNPAAGIELMKVRCSKESRAVLPIDNVDGIRFLRENGFAETRRVKRMVWGRDLAWRPDCLYNRVAGNLG